MLFIPNRFNCSSKVWHSWDQSVMAVGGILKAFFQFFSVQNAKLYSNPWRKIKEEKCQKMHFDKILKSRALTGKACVFVFFVGQSTSIRNCRKHVSLSWFSDQRPRIATRILHQLFHFHEACVWMELKSLNIARPQLAKMIPKLCDRDDQTHMNGDHTLCGDSQTFSFNVWWL